ncbi:MAG: WD40 repeat domain-containing protein, partial [Actinomycetota bacterium]|nr:WD40 repeat domain-containing protein [Actinomycetota bacterium]
VIPLSAEELERAISGPAKRGDVTLEPGLVAAMLGDVAEEPGGLPLMEYALTELFERRDDRVLFLEAYRQIGGVSGALGRRAEELYGELDDDGKEAARQLFLRLVALGEGTEDTRRRVPRAEVASLDVDQQAMTTVLDTFGASRQLSFDRDARTGAPTIELAHEAMLTAWPRLHRWIDAAREDLRTERRVAAAARDWIEADRDPSFLLSGSRLEQTETWEATSGLAVTPEEREYLDASRAERERRNADEEARRAHEDELERRSFRRLRALVAVLGVAVLVAIGLTVFATNERERAERERRNATARELAAASAANLDVDPERSILLALEAIDATRSVDGTVLSEAEEALHRAVTSSRVVRTVRDLGGTVDWSAEGIFVTEGPENTGRIDLRDVSTGDRVRAWHGHEIDMNEARFSEDGSLLATAGDDGRLRIWDPGSGKLVSTIRGEVGGAVGQSFDADGTLVAATWPEEGVVRVADPTTGRVVRAIDGLNTVFPFDTALSPDGRQVVVGVGGWDDARVFDVATGELVFVLPRHRYSVNTVAWSPDGRWIATGAGDSSIRVWDAATGELGERLLGHTGVVNTVDWAPDSRRLVSGGSDGTARVWEIEEHRTRRGAEVEGREMFTLTAQQTQSALFAAFSPDGRGVLTGDVEISAAKIWDLSVRGDEEVVNLPTDYLAPVDVTFLRDGRIVASHEGGAASIWEADGTHVASLGPGGGSDEPVWRIDASPDGSRVATVRNVGGTVSVWNTETGDRVFETVVVPDGEVSWIDWNPDGRHLAVGDFGGSLTILDGDGDKVQVVHEPEPHSIEALAFSPDGRTIATASLNNQDPDTSHVSLWDWERGEVVRTLDVVGASALAFDPTGSTIVAGRFDGSVEVRDVATGEHVRRFGAHGAFVWEVVFSPDGERIATAGEDATIAIFDAETAQRQLVLPGHDLLVSGLAFSPDGRRLVSTSPDGVVRVWTLDLDELIRIARTEVTRQLSDDECRQYLHLREGCQ